MATDRIIPNRPIPDESKIPAADKDLISYVVAMGVPNQVAYARFHPEFLDASGKLNKTGKGACTQFFTYAKNKEYADAYRQTLAEFLNRGVAVNSDMESEEIDGDALARKILSDLAAMVKNGRIQDFEILKIATDILNKYGVLKGSEERVIPPIRFLPERCFSSCRYRLFVENAVKGGSVIDECQYCKALAFANENGYKDDSTKRLDIPKEILDAEPENTVKTVDILSGKVEN